VTELSPPKIDNTDEISGKTIAMKQVVAINTEVQIRFLKKD
jgi:hypothetical protein